MDLFIDIDNCGAANSNLPAYKKLAQAIRAAIEDGRLKPGEPVPSTRELASRARVCRATVLKAYEELEDAGIIATDPGRVSIVRDIPFFGAGKDAAGGKNLPEDQGTDNGSSFDLADGSSNISDEAAADLNFATSRFAERFIHGLSTGSGDVDEFAISSNYTIAKRFAKITRRQCRKDLHKQLFDDNGESKERAKQAMAAFVRRARAVNTRPSQAFLATERESAIHQISGLILRRGDSVLIPAGCPDSVRAIFQAHGARLVECPVDMSGLSLNFNANGSGNGELVDRTARGSYDRFDLAMQDSSHRIQAIYINPSHHQPTGIVTSLSRRLEILNFARKNGAYIIEDDIESAFDYGARRIPAIQALGGEDRVFYVSSLFDIFTQFTRLTLITVPKDRLDEFAAITTEDDISTLVLNTVAELIDEGHLELYLNHKKRQQANLKRRLIYAVTRHLRDVASVLTQTASARQTIRFDSRGPQETLETILEAARKSGLNVEGAEELCAPSSRKNRRDVIVNLSCMLEEEIETAVERWALNLSESGAATPVRHPGQVAAAAPFNAAPRPDLNRLTVLPKPFLPQSGAESGIAMGTETGS